MGEALRFEPLRFDTVAMAKACISRLAHCRNSLYSRLETWKSAEPS